MLHVRSIIRNGSFSLSILILTLFAPITAVSADSTATSTCKPPASSQPGVHWPTGSMASTFTYQCTGPYAGMWTNQYYVFDPSTDSQSPLYSPDYSYDCTTGVWTKTEYDFDAATGEYIKDRVTTSSPGLPTNCPVVAPVAAGNSSSPSTPATKTTAADASSMATTNNNGMGSGGVSPNGSSTNTAISSTGPGSINGSSTSGINNIGINNATNVDMNNNVTAAANSGNTLVMGNTSAGNATSGLSQNEANIVNMLQSSSNILGNGNQVMTFTANINGDVNGNLLIDPNQLSQVQNTGPGSINNSSANLTNNLTVNNSTGAAINNNIDLASTSGNATVTGNTTGGNASTGAAETIANVVNSIDSAINAGKSFIGTININGNLNGNILLPPDFVNQLLAANVPTVNITGPGSSNGSNTNFTNNSTVNNTNNLGINNTITTNAATGNASVSGNTSGGSATSGSTDNNITAFNLTGSNVIGSNDILVFVNVTGKWVGLIMNAPAGATAAEFGGGITSSGPASSNSANTNVNNNSTLNNTFNGQINNNIVTTADSGNATVDYNTKGGNASTGNADNAVNLLNIEHSSLNLTGWFGILFINVFGSWNGNFGVSPLANSSPGSGSSGSPAPVSPTNMAVFRFMPTNSSSGGHSSFHITPLYAPFTNFGSFNASSPNNGNGNVYGGAVLAADTTQGIQNSGKFVPSRQSQRQDNLPHSNFTKTALTIGGLVVLYILADALVTNRHAIIRKVKSLKMH